MTTCHGKTALVTGASRGIGRATAVALAKAGAQVLVHYGRGADEARSVVEQITRGGRPGRSRRRRPGQPDGPHKARRHGSGDRRRPAGHPGRQRRHLARPRRSRRPRSRISTRCSQSMSAHPLPCAAATADPEGRLQRHLPLLARCARGRGQPFRLRRDQGRDRHAGQALRPILGPRGIRVNAVAPGVVETDMSSFAKTDAGRDFTLGMQALKRVAQPDDIAGAIAFLASDAARWVAATRCASTAARNYNQGDCNVR